MKITVTADTPFTIKMDLTEGREYEVITYFEHNGNKLVLINDDTYESNTYNICHFKNIQFKEK